MGLLANKVYLILSYLIEVFIRLLAVVSRSPADLFEIENPGQSNGREQLGIAFPGIKSLFPEQSIPSYILYWIELYIFTLCPYKYTLCADLIKTFCPGFKMQEMDS